MKITPDAHKDIIEAYTINLWSMQEIADILHVSRTAVHKFLKNKGVDTSKRKITVSCTVCREPIERTKKRVRKQKNHFCSTDCYSAFLDAGKSSYIGNRHGQRMARRVVSEYFDLQPEHVVHHEDRNTYNNIPQNLKVFANQGDHTRYHHSMRNQYFNKITNIHREAIEKEPYYKEFEVEPIWDGSVMPNF